MYLIGKILDKLSPALFLLANWKMLQDDYQIINTFVNKPFRIKTIFCSCICKNVIVWKNSSVTFHSITTPLKEKDLEWAEEGKLQQLHSTVPNILRDIFVLTVFFPRHPCFNALWITDNPLCTFYSLTDVILQQLAAGYMTGIFCMGGFAIITPVTAINLKYPIISASASRIVVCSPCVIITFPFGHTHPGRQADTFKAIHPKSFQSFGQLTSLKDLALDGDGQEEKPQKKESLHVD